MKPSSSLRRAAQLTALNTPHFHSQALAQRVAQSAAQRELPRERMLASGPSALSPQELLALLLNTGRGSACDVMRLSQELLSRLGSLARLSEASVEELTQLKGIGPVKATRLIAAFELARRAHNELSPSPRAAEELPQRPRDPLLDLIERALSSAPISERGGGVSLIAYPTETELYAPAELVTLSLDQSLSSLGEPQELSAQARHWLKRLLLTESSSWSLVALFNPQSAQAELGAEGPNLGGEQRGLDELAQRAESIGLALDSYLIIHGERYAWLTPGGGVTQGKSGGDQS